MTEAHDREPVDDEPLAPTPPDPHLILLIEDEPGDQQLISGLLADFRAWEIICVPTLAAAQKLLRTTPVEVVLLDLGLPDAQGLEALTAVLSMQGVPPIVVLTGHAEAGLGQGAINIGAEDFLAKSLLHAPNGDVLLERALRYATSRHRQRRMLQRESAELRWVSARQQKLLNDLTDDLQKPITALFGLVTTLTERQKVLRAAERAELVSKIEHTTRSLSRRLAEIISDADPVLGARSARRRVRMADIVPAAINSVGERPDGTRVSLEGDHPVVWGRPDALQTAVTEMVRNAVIHAAPGTAPQVQVHVSAYGNGVRVTVSDDGPLIPAARRGGVFEAGVTLDAHSDRDGMGLAHVRAVAAEHGGAVWLEASDLGGNAITLVIPQRGVPREAEVEERERLDAGQLAER